MGAVHRVEFSFGRVEHAAEPPSRWVRVEDHLLPPEVTLTLPPTTAGEPEVVATFAVIDSAPECTEIRLRASQRRAGLRQADVSEFSVSDWTQRAFGMVAQKVTEQRAGELDVDLAATAEGQLAARGVVERARRARSPRKVTPEFLERVAAIYRDHLGNNPTQAVAEHFGGAHRTAAGYVQQARRAGLLPATTPGRKNA